MANKVIILLLLLLIIPIASAELFLGDFCGGCTMLAPGECIDIPSACDNCSYTNITILYPNGTAIVENEAMTNLSSSYYYNYTFCDTETIGTYTIITNYDEDGAYLYSDSNFFEVTYSGLYLSESKAILYIGFLGIIVLVFLAGFFGIGMLPNDNARDEEGALLSISYLKYLRNIIWLFEWMMMISIFYISSNLAFAYLGEQMFAKFLFALFQVSLALTPVIIVCWIIWFFVKIAEDKTLRKLMDRGFTTI